MPFDTDSDSEMLGLPDTKEQDDALDNYTEHIVVPSIQSEKNLIFSSDIVDQSGISEYELVVLAAKRGRDLSLGTTTKLDVKDWEKRASIVMMELSEELTNTDSLKREYMNSTASTIQISLDDNLYNLHEQDDGYYNHMSSQVETNNEDCERLFALLNPND